MKPKAFAWSKLGLIIKVNFFGQQRFLPARISSPAELESEFNRYTGWCSGLNRPRNNFWKNMGVVTIEICTSWFRCTDQTVNVGISQLTVVFKVFCIQSHVNVCQESHYWCFSLLTTLLFLGCCYVLMVSFLAHMLNSMSASAQELCMCVDYGAIATYGITNMIVYQLYVCPLKCFLDAGEDRDCSAREKQNVLSFYFLLSNQVLLHDSWLHHCSASSLPKHAVWDTTKLP